MPPEPLCCSATTDGGQACQARPLHGTDRCFAHSADPAVAGARDEARQRGGQARAAPRLLSRDEAAKLIRLRSPGDVPTTLEEVARAVACGRLETRAGNLVVLAASAAVRASDTADLARRLADLEAAMGRRTR